MLVIASAIASRADAAASSSATGRALAHRHRLAGRDVEAGRRHRRVGDRHLPRPHHLIARDQPADGAIADGDEERLVGDGRQPQHPADRLGQMDRRRSRTARPAPRRAPPRASCAAACPAARRSGRSIGVVAEQAVLDQQPAVVGGVADDRVRTALARRQRHERLQAVGRDRQHVALLGLVAPQLQRRQPGLVAGDRRAGRRARRGRCRAPARAARSRCRPRRRRGSTGSGCRRRARRSDRSPPGSGAASRRCHAAPTRSRDPPATMPDASDDAAPPPSPISIAGPPSTTIGRARRDVGLLHVLGADVAEAARHHDRLVVAVASRARAAPRPPSRTSGSSRQVRPPELVVERGAAQRRLDHDVQRARDPVGLAVVLLPGTRARPAGAGSTPRSRSAPPSGRAPRPVAPSSRISPPEPVAAPGNGEIAVGWLWVSTFITMCIGSACAP